MPLNFSDSFLFGAVAPAALVEAQDEDAAAPETWLAFPKLGLIGGFYYSQPHRAMYCSRRSFGTCGSRPASARHQ